MSVKHTSGQNELVAPVTMLFEKIKMEDQLKRVLP